MDGVVRLQEAIGVELLRCKLLAGPPLRVLGRYEIEGFLGRGASGLVVSARDLRLDRPVALKLSIVDADEVDLSEARALAKIDHPNVVRVHDADMMFGTLQGHAWRLRVLVMQRADGVTLRSWLSAEERSVDEILDVFRGAGRGLEAAHEQRIAHRDFKPDNVLVQANGVPQVLDFGFALAASSTRSAREGRRALVAGTDDYMAPEAWDGIASARADQYAFGISLVEALTDKVAPPPFWRPPHVPHYAWRALRRATRRNPARRYGSMTQLLERLERPRRWPLAAAAAATLVLASAYGVHVIDWTSMSVATLAGADAGRQSRGDASAAPQASATASEVPVADVPAPEEHAPDVSPPMPRATRAVADAGPVIEIPGPACIALSAPRQEQLRADSAIHGLYGCYLLDLTPDVDGCAEVTGLRKLGSSSDSGFCDGSLRDRSTPSPNNGSPQEGVDLSSSRSGEGLVVETTVGPRHYHFVLRSGRERLLEGTFTSELPGHPGGGAHPDNGTLVEVP